MGLRLLLISSVFLFLYVSTSETMPVKAGRQYLPPLPGYIPVYIQDGESPPDVESIYEVMDQSPTNDKMDTDVQDAPLRADSDPDSILRESKDFIVQQLLRGALRDNEVGDLQELRKMQSQS